MDAREVLAASSGRTRSAVYTLPSPALLPAPLLTRTTLRSAPLSALLAFMSGVESAPAPRRQGKHEQQPRFFVSRLPPLATIHAARSVGESLACAFVARFGSRLGDSTEGGGGGGDGGRVTKRWGPQVAPLFLVAGHSAYAVLACLADLS